MSSYADARAALERTVRRVFPTAKRIEAWAGIEAWGAPRPAAAVEPRTRGTYDPALVVIGIADRKAGPTVYFLDPGDYFVLETNKALLEQAGLALGRGCIYPKAKGPLPTAALEALFRRVKARDAATARAKKAGAPATRAKAASPAKKPKTVDNYLAALPAKQRLALDRVRRLVHQAAPGATEAISYGMPTFRLGKRNLVHMAAFRDHCSFFPGRAGVAALFPRELAAFETAKGTIRFRPEKPLPADLVKRIVRLRVAEVEGRATARRAAKPKAKAAPLKRPRGAAARTRGTQARRAP